MIGKFLTAKGNKDGSCALYFGKGLDRKGLIDLEGLDIEITRVRAKVQTPAELILADIDAKIEELLTKVREARESINSGSIGVKPSACPTEQEAGPGEMKGDNHEQ